MQTEGQVGAALVLAVTIALNSSRGRDPYSSAAVLVELSARPIFGAVVALAGLVGAVVRCCAPEGAGAHAEQVMRVSKVDEKISLIIKPSCA